APAGASRPLGVAARGRSSAHRAGARGCEAAAARAGGSARGRGSRACRQTGAIGARTGVCPRQAGAQARVRHPRAGDGELARPVFVRKDVTLARAGRRVRLATVVAGVALAGLVAPAAAQDISINFGQGGGLTERVVQLIALLTVLS